MLLCLIETVGGGIVENAKLCLIQPKVNLYQMSVRSALRRFTKVTERFFQFSQSKDINNLVTNYTDLILEGWLIIEHLTWRHRALRDTTQEISECP